MSSLQNLRCGLAGWAFPHWDGVVYPHTVSRSFHPLEFLAERFDTVEIPHTFYHVPKPEIARFWVDRVRHNGRFQFTARLPRLFTHCRELNAETVKAFLAGMRPLTESGKLGCVLMQFPASFRYTEENRQWLIQLRRTFSMFPLVAELRHGTWALEEGIGTLIEKHIGFCNLDQPESVRATPPTALLTWRIGYVKLHGRKCGSGHEAFDDSRVRTHGNNYLYGLRELEEWKARIAKFAPFADQTFVIFNNDGGGRSFLNATQMQTLLSAPAAERRGMVAETRRAATALAVA